MPSAAIKQRLPAELWKNPQPSSKSVSSRSSPIQAHPGGSEFFEASPKHRNPSHQNLVRRQFTPSNKKRNNLQRRGSSDDILSTDVRCRSEETVRVSVSSCSDSECGVSYSSTSDCRDLYASDSFKAPDGNALPLPPSTWLGCFPPKNNNKDKSHAMNKASLQLQAFLGLVPADRRP